MELSQMLAMVDHTLLKPESTWAQIKAICDDAMKYHTATVCIPACYVARGKAYFGLVDADVIYFAVLADKVIAMVGRVSLHVNGKKLGF